MTNKFPSKILLIGEYSLVTGGSGLAIPYHHYSGELQFNSSHGSLDSNHSISHLLNYLKLRLNNEPELNLEQMELDLQNGLWFNSTIPTGYGLGSSGALVSAIYNKYKLFKQPELLKLKSQLAAMESFFHGSSSGVDPLVALIQKPILIKKDQVIVLDSWSLDKLGCSLYLVDTGLKSKTISLVDWFKTKMLQNTFREATIRDYVLPNEAVIGNIESGEPVNFENIMEISRYQLEYLSPMVTDPFRKHFFAGLESEAFAFKLCGSGGGGFMLCFVTDERVAENYFAKNQLPFQKVN